MTNHAPLVDSFGRIHTNLRLSVTDRCNIRCFYCMPADGIQFQPREKLLSYEEMHRFVRIVGEMGVDKIRITGGEPLVRADLPVLIQMLSGLPQIHDIALTTNGMLLAEHAADLKLAGLQRLNISLDTLSEETFQHISRRTGLQQVIDGIGTAMDVGFDKIRLNAIAIKDLTEPDVIPLAKFSRERNLELRFIEFMPLDAEDRWETENVLTGAEIRSIIESEFGTLSPAARTDASQPSVDYRYEDKNCFVGFINPVSEPFCGDCNRLRLTCEGQVRSCLFSTEEWDARELLRNGGSDSEIGDLIVDCVANKKRGHLIDSDGFQKPERAMYQIGG